MSNDKVDSTERPESPEEKDIEIRKVELEEERFKEEIRLKDKELELRAREIDLQEKQFETSQKAKTVWSQVFSPVGVAVVVGLLGLIGTAVSGLLNVKLASDKQRTDQILEKQKQEAALILKMSEIKDAKQRALNLLFFAQVGYLDFDKKRIESLSDLAGLPRGAQAPPPSVAPTALVDIPNERNEGLSQVKTETLRRIFGSPVDCTPEYGFISNPKIKSLVVTEDVDRFKVTGIKPFIDALRRVFTEIQSQDPEFYSQIKDLKNLGTFRCPGPAGSINSRVPTRHSYGIAIDLMFSGDGDSFKTARGKTQSGLARIYPYFNKEKLFWLVEDRYGDSMHFEASNELIEEWEQNGILNP